MDDAHNRALVHGDPSFVTLVRNALGAGLERAVHYPQEALMRSLVAAASSTVGVLAFLALVGVGSGGCAAPAPEDNVGEARASTNQSIVGGNTSNGHDAVVLISNGGQPWCTGTMVTPNLVLTARHCVTEFYDNSDCGTVKSDMPASIFTVSTGLYPNAQQSAGRGSRLYVPASKDVFCGNDVALILLDKDITGATPATIRFSALSTNETGTAVGYGASGQGGPPTRRERGGVEVLAVGPVNNASYNTPQGPITQIEVDQNEVMVSESICDGDSGGPLLDSSGQIMAVASEGLDNACWNRPAFYSGVAPHQALIKDAATASGHPLDGTASGNPNPSGNPQNATGDSPAKAGAGNAQGTQDPDDEKANGKTKSSRSAGSLGSSGCNAAASSTGASLLEMALAIFAVTLLRRRRRSPRDR